jgi:hypothetical protein
MSSLEKFMARAKSATKPPPLRALDAETGEPIPLPPPDWKWTWLHRLSFGLKIISIVLGITHLIPGQWAATIFAIASCSKDLLILIGDYLDNGIPDKSFTPEA